MGVGVLRLDSLPIEILRRILLFGDCFGALALSKASKFFRRLCADPLLYINIIEDNDDDSQLAERGPWWKHVGLESSKGWTICARWALADAKARRLAAQSSPDSRCLLSADMLHWLPELATYRHGVAISLLRAPAGFICPEEHMPAIWTPELVARTAFLDTCRCTLLKDSGPLPMYDSVPAALRSSHSWSFIDLYEDTLSALGNLWNARVAWRSYQPHARGAQGDHVKFIMFGTLLVGAMYRRLIAAIDGRRLGRMNIQSINLPPPTARNIPFDSFFAGCESPFTALATGDVRQGLSNTFLASHLASMTAASFVADGEWIGYYSYPDAYSPPAWDAMMLGIHFEVVADYVDYCAVRATGNDGCGQFSLYGTIYKSNGWVLMAKRYNPGPTWNWFAFMTPFGIVGTWGDVWGGWCWLWKRSWSPSEVSHS